VPNLSRMNLNRRQFLGLVGAVAAITGLPEAAVAKSLANPSRRARDAAGLTTLAETLAAGPAGDLGYRKVVTRPGERHIVRSEIVKPVDGRQGRRTTLVNFVHLTDQHIIDVQSPSRVEFLDRYNDGECSPMPFSAAFRPQEAASARITDAMLRRLRAIKYSPVTGAPIQAMIATGDNTDNQQLNELELFIGLMDGTKVKPNSGDPKHYEGIQASGDLNYWHPGADVADLYKTKFGFPDAPGFLENALAPIDSVGAGMRWYTCYGNHDGLAQGNAPVNPAFGRIAVGGTKVVGLPSGANPCSEFAGPAATGPGFAVTPDESRRYASRSEWVQKHLDSPGLPHGHGFTDDNLDPATLYYAADVGKVRWIVLDTVNPGGYADGSIGDAQLTWLGEELAKAQQQRKLVIIFSHHGPRSLENPLQNPDPLDADSTDLPRHQADAVLEVVNQYSCVIAWVNGHSHNNVITQRGAWWDIGTAAHIDWPPQSRLIEVVDNRDGTLSIFATMVDHAGDSVVNLARELMGNDPQAGFTHGTGAPEDRNVELLLKNPFPGKQEDMVVDNRTAIPPTGIPKNLAIGGALALVGTRKLIDFRERNAPDSS
jgi:metallophosphoesterase (TIGR03767 family)